MARLRPGTRTTDTGLSAGWLIHHPATQAQEHTSAKTATGRRGSEIYCGHVARPRGADQGTWTHRHEAPTIVRGASRLGTSLNLPIHNIPVIVVASGKGGVGKTTVAVNLALALTERGRSVGLVDADLYGPDVPRMLGLRRQKDTSSLTVFGVKGSPGSRLEAIQRHGIQLISAGFLLGEDQGISVDAAIARLIIRRLIEDTIWKGIEYLIIDLPPGTADIQQFIFALRGRPVFPLIVVTPQVVAHQDARRLIAVLSRRRMQTIGGVENMSESICMHCGELSPLFSQASDGDSIWNSTRKLASIPFSYQAAQDADKGLPVFLTREVPAQVAAYELIATEVDRHIESAMKAELEPCLSPWSPVAPSSCSRRTSACRACSLLMCT